jgi:hypothetical protein
MNASRNAVIGALASVGLLGSVAAGFAQTPASQQGGRMIEVPPGAVVLVLPAGAMAAPDFPFPDMPSPVAMIRQMDQMMADMQRGFATQEAAFGALPRTEGGVTSVVVTSVSNGHGTCTQRVTYAGNGAPPVVQVSSTGDACASAGMPAATPDTQAPAGGTPHLIQVQDKARRIAPLTYAQAGE